MLSLNGFGEVPQRIRWDQFVAGFAPLSVKEDGFGSRWRLDHPTHPIGFHAIVADDSIGSVQFWGEDLAALGEEPSCFSHPVWAGIFKAFVSWPAVFTMESPSFDKALFVARPDLLQQLPWWVDRHRLRFVVPDRAEFDSLMGEAFALDRAHWAISARDGWADEIDRDAEALEAFANFVDGKKEKVRTYTLGGQPVSPQCDMSGSFLTLYGENIDWRQADDEIIECFGKRFKNPQLSVGPSNDALEIVFRDSSRLLSFEHIGKDRYQTLRALNEVLAPDFQIRLVRASTDGDTHCLLFAPAWLWTHLEARDRKKLNRKVKIIGPHDGFH